MSDRPRTRGPAVDVLVVESRPDQARRIREAFEAADARTRLHVVADEEAAIEVCSRAASDGGPPRPSVVLLDPTSDAAGTRLVERLKTEPESRRIPVIVLTEEEEEHEVDTWYALHANAVVRKPEDCDRLAEFVESLASFWLHTVRLPPAPSR